MCWEGEGQSSSARGDCPGLEWDLWLGSCTLFVHTDMTINTRLKSKMFQ